jgi:hypothetical protein
MTYKPGDILYRKYSDNNDLYCVVGVEDGPFNIGPNVKLVRMLGHYSTTHIPVTVQSEVSISVDEWYVKVDLNNYDIKDKFLSKIKEFLKTNLGKAIDYDLILDNLTYIEIMDALRKYQKNDIIVDGEKE